MKSSSSFASRHVGIVAAILATGCASRNAVVPLPSSDARATAAVVEVTGHVVQVGARQVAYIEAFPSAVVPLLGAPVALQTSSVPAAQVAAVVTHVEPRADGWLEVEADLVRRDAHLATATPFTGQIFLNGRYAEARLR